MTRTIHLPEFDTWHALKYASTFASTDQARPILTNVFLYETDTNFWLAATDSYRLGWAVVPKPGVGVIGDVLPTADQFVCMLDHRKILAVKGYKPTPASEYPITITPNAAGGHTWQLPGSPDTIGLIEQGTPPNWRDMFDPKLYDETFTTKVTAATNLNPELLAKTLTAIRGFTKAHSAETPVMLFSSTEHRPTFISVGNQPIGALIMPVRYQTTRFTWKK